MEFRKRTLAFLIDQIIVILIIMFCAVIEHFLTGGSLDCTIYIVLGILTIFAVLYYIGKDIIKGKSIGKRIVKIKVVGVNGKKPAIWQLLLRNVTFLIWPVKAVLLLAGKKKLGDILSKTDVICEV